MFSYLGGKKFQAKWIADHFPEFDNYVEPFGGAMWVYVIKTPARIASPRAIPLAIAETQAVFVNAEKRNDLFVSAVFLLLAPF